MGLPPSSVELGADAALSGAPHDLVPDRQVPRRNPVRLEDHDVAVGLPAW
jgi:hypothetical protein